MKMTIKKQNLKIKILENKKPAQIQGINFYKQKMKLYKIKNLKMNLILKIVFKMKNLYLLQKIGMVALYKKII